MSMTALVSSSTYSGTPSLRFTICWISASSIGESPATCLAMATHWSRPSGLHVRAVACGRSAPGVCEFRPVRDDRQHAARLDARQQPFHQSLRRRVAPVGVFQQEQHRHTVRNGEHEVFENRKYLHVALRRCHLHRRHAVGRGKFQQLRDQQQVPARRPAGAREQGFKAAQILIDGALGLNGGFVPQQLDQRVQRAVAVIG